MKFNNREEIKEILEMDIENKEKRNLIANIKNIETDLSRIIAVDFELEIEVGQEWSNLEKATSWADLNKDIHNIGFRVENNNTIEYVLKVENVKGYEVQYFDFETLFDTLAENMDEEEAEELAEGLAEDKIYLELMDLLGADAEMRDEREILVPAETRMEIVEINDGREDLGYIEVMLKEIK